jgi:hypothetical protein
VPIDCDAIPGSAEKLLQQAKLEPAIAEYRRIVDEHPEDWTTANILGDLDIPVGQRALAICLDLQAQAGDYRDLSARISRLTKAQARG